MRLILLNRCYFWDDLRGEVADPYDDEVADYVLADDDDERYLKTKTQCVHELSLR